MVDLFSMFRRRPAKRGKGFARSREDITALGDSVGNMLTSPVRDAPPIARDASMTGLHLSRPAPAVELSREQARDLPREQPRDMPRAERPRPRPKPATTVVVAGCSHIAAEDAGVAAASANA